MPSPSRPEIGHHRLFISADQRDDAAHLWLEIADEDGACGFAPVARNEAAAVDRRLLALRAEAPSPGAGELPPPIEMALLDLWLRHRQIPLQNWLGAPAARTFAVARGLLALPCDDVASDDLAREARGAVAEGCTTLSLHHGGAPTEIAETVAALRAAIGPEIALRLFLPGRLGPAEADDLLTRLRPFHLAAVVDPVGSVAAAARLIAGLPPVGLHAAITDTPSLAVAARSGRVALAMLNALRHGGIAGVLRLGRLAHIHQIELCLSGAFGTAWELQLAARLTAALPMATAAIEPGAAGRIEPSPSRLALSEEPGLAPAPPTGPSIDPVSLEGLAP